MSATPQVMLLDERRRPMRTVCPPRVRRATNARGVHTGAVLSLLSGAIALSTYDLYVLVRLLVG